MSRTELLPFARSSTSHTVRLEAPERFHQLAAIGPSLDLETESIQVEARTLDSLAFGHVGLFKIYVEGYELEVLTSAIETLKQRPILIVEAEERHRESVVNSIRYFLESLGYKGSFLINGVEVPLERFTSNLQSSGATTPLGGKTGLYINNFIFRHTQ